MQSRTSLKWLAVLAFLLGTAPALHAQSLVTARELYASAEYNDALTMLDSLAVREQSQEDRRAIELYRTLCLLAVGRRDDADRAIEALVTTDPLYRPSDDIPPRMRSAFTDTRKRLLPSILQQKYMEAKAAFDKDDFVGAVEGFKQVLDGLADPDVAAAAGQQPLSDLRTLAVGFHELSVKAATPPPAPPAPEPAAPAAPPVQRLYGMGDPGVVHPVTILQRVPPFRGRVLTGGTGILEIIIDETGAVEAARMRVPLNGAYDKLVLTAAKTWQYQPATINGVPVRFRKMVQVSLLPSAQ